MIGVHRKDTPYPTRLKIEHTNFCNSQCIMCSHYFSNNANAKMVDDCLEERITSLLLHVKRVLLHGSGEPLLHPHITEYIERYASMGIDVTCNTNLSIMTSELACAINKAFKKISVSCDGSTAKIFEGIRQGLDFQKFVDNLKLLRRMCPTLIIKIYTVVLRQNIMQLPEIVKFAHQTGCDSMVITDLNPKEILGNEKDMVRNYPAVTKRFLREALEVASKLQFIVDYPRYLLELPNVRDYDIEIRMMEEMTLFPDREFQKKLQAFYKTLKLKTYSVRADLNTFMSMSGYHCIGICNYLMEEPYIDVNGEVFPCCANGQYNIGNIYEQEFEDIWDNEYYRSLRKLFSEGEIPNYCKGCLYLRNHYLGDVEVLDIDDDFYRHQYNVDMESLTGQFKDFCERWDETDGEIVG